MLGILSKSYMIATRAEAFAPTEPARGLFGFLKARRERAQIAEELRALSDAQLRDVGLTRADVERAAPRDPWEFRR